RSGPVFLRMASVLLGDMTALRSHADDGRPLSRRKQTGLRRELFALAVRETQHLGDHRHHDPVGPLMKKPVYLVSERFEIDSLVGEVGGLENGENSREGGGSGFTHDGLSLPEKER